MAPKKKKDRFVEAQAIIARQTPASRGGTGPEERVFSSTLPKEGVLPSDPRLKQGFKVNDRQVSKEEFEAEKVKRKGEIPPAGFVEKAPAPPTPEQIAQEAGITQEPQQAVVQQQEQPLRLDQQVARLGLSLPTAVGNALTSAIESVTGKQFGRQTTTELAQTGTGEALGLAITGTALATGGLFVYESYLAGLSAQQLINIAGTKALPTAVKLPAVSTLTKLTTSKILLGGAGITFIRTNRKDAKQAIIAQRTIINDVLEDVQLRGKSFSQAQSDFNRIEIDIAGLESSLKFWRNLSLEYWLGGGKDDAVDVEITKGELENARLMLIGVATEAASKRLQAR